jgi:hypothetical protein
MTLRLLVFATFGLRSAKPPLFAAAFGDLVDDA